MPKMRTSFQGLVQLLARSLYPEPEVFIRELLQNAHDSIQLRRVQEPQLAGEICIRVDPQTRTLSFSDNGAGMDRRDIEEFLSTIGSTGTGVQARRLAERNIAVRTIGQFGIGLLSAFVVAERIDVYTRKSDSHEAWHWVNYGGEDYELEPLPVAEQAVGARVVVTLAPVHAGYGDPATVRNTIKRYADFLPFPILLNDQGIVNTIDAPWHRDDWPARADTTLRHFIARRYNVTPLHLISVELQSPRARGVLYIPLHTGPGAQGGGVVDIFQERMCIRLNDSEFLPEWADFLRGIIDSPDLQPTAARDNLRRDETYRRLRRKLGKLLLRELIRLAQEERATFLKLCDWQHATIKGMAVQYPEFYQAVIDYLPFETNRGMLTLPAYGQAQPLQADGKTPLYFFTHGPDAQQFYDLCAARGWLAVNTGRQHDEALLRRYAAERGWALKPLDTLDDPALYEPLEPREQADYRSLERALTQSLAAAGIEGVRPGVRRFLPADLSAVLIAPSRFKAIDRMEQLLARPLLLEGLEELARDVREQLRQHPLELFLNANHPLIQRLREWDGLADPARQSLLMGLYGGALLTARQRLTPDNARLLVAQWQTLLHANLDLQQENRRLREQLSAMAESN